MNAYYLHKPDGTKTDLSVCAECGKLARGESNFDISQKCCACYECGEPIPKEERFTANTMYHRKCDDARRRRIDAEALAKAELVEDYDGPVYFEGGHGSFGDSYFSDVDELAEWLDDQDEDVVRPEFAFCCEEYPFKGLDTDQLIEQCCEEMEEDSADHLDGVDALNEAILAFNKANESHISWFCDRKRKVAVPPAQR